MGHESWITVTHDGFWKTVVTNHFVKHDLRQLRCGARRVRSNRMKLLGETTDKHDNRIKPALLFGKLVMRSMLMSVHGVSGIDSDCKSPAGLSCEGLLR